MIVISALLSAGTLNQHGWKRITPVTTPPATMHAVAVYLDVSETVIMFGGTSDDRWLDDTWEWDGTTWIPVTSVARPPARDKHAMAYDESRGRIVLFGGRMNGTLFDDTWEWDGEDWHSVQPEHQPPARCCHAMAYDPVQQRVIMYGGWDSEYNVFLDDTWVWDGTDWKEVTCCGAPLMSGHEMQSFTERDETIAVMTSTLGTWAWDGEEWRDLHTVSPPSRSDSQLAYDGARHRLTLFGGSADGQLLNDTWIYDGEEWIELSLSVLPEARAGHVMFYDPRRREIILFGGAGVAGRLNDTWRLSLPTDLSQFIIQP
jgi:hypothetical protein